jgi:flagellar export protein FliJ
MSSFSFRLQRLLGFRHIQEEEAKRELGIRRLAMEKEATRLSNLRREEEEVLRQWRRQLDQEIELPRLQLTQEYSRVLENRLLSQSEQHRKSEDRVNEQREVARQCWRKKRMLEVLKNKAKLEHLQLEQVAEQNLIDELVMNSYFRKGGDEK